MTFPSLSPRPLRLAATLCLVAAGVLASPAASAQPLQGPPPPQALPAPQPLPPVPGLPPVQPLPPMQGLAPAQPPRPFAPPPSPGQPGLATGSLPTVPGAPLGPAAQPGRPDQLAAALAPSPGGLTADQAAQIAARTRHSVRAKQAELAAAAARVDQALVTFFPRLSVTAAYTRLSPVNNQLGSGGGLVGSQNLGPLITGPCPPGSPFPAGTTCVLDSGRTPVASQSVAFPSLVNNYSLVASISVPVSDYLLRVTQNYRSATHAEKGKKYEVAAEALQAAADARLTYFNWVRFKGDVVVAHESLDAARAHLADARRAFEVGLTSRADVLRLDAQVAAAEQLVAEAEAGAAVAEEQLRIVIGAPTEQALVIGTDVLQEPAAPPAETLQTLQDQALGRRLELRSLDETELSLKDVERVARAGYLPRLDAFGDVTYANPNARIFPAKNQFDATWDVGLRASWVLNDSFTAAGQTAEARAHVASVIEQRGAIRDGLRLEVAAAYADAMKVVPTLEAAARGIVAAEESLRVRRELFRNGKATSVDLIDAETEVTRARLRWLDAHVGFLTARARLDHATGRDAAGIDVDRITASPGGGPGPSPAR